MIEQKTIDRFWKKVDKKGENDCWNWAACKTFGYGSFWFNGKQRKAHRFSWLLHNKEIPEGLLVCHHCDNPGCVNPSHLFVGSQSANIQDAVKKGRWVRESKKGEEAPNVKLSEKQVLSIRYEYGKMTNKSQRKLAKKYGIGKSQANAIINRKSWKHI